jgi:hypothetical protein
MGVGTVWLNSCQLNCKKLTKWTISAAPRAKAQNPAGAGFCVGSALVRSGPSVLPDGALARVVSALAATACPVTQAQTGVS